MNINNATMAISRIICLFCIILLIVLPAIGHADIYKWKDENGVWCITDDPSKVPKEHRKPHVFKTPPQSVGLRWPIDCIIGKTCDRVIGYPDINGTGKAFDGGQPGYKGHTGTDIGITWAQMDKGVNVYAAVDGQVLWVFDGKYDRCPDPKEPDCQAPVSTKPGKSSGYTVCTESGNYCDTGSCCCFWCFNGGNTVVLRHANVPGIFATLYGHLRRNSTLVVPGAFVKRGQRIASVGSSGSSSGPHLHFEVWGSGFYKPSDPWENELWDMKTLRKR